ncbi:MAG: alpha/beta hydrolase [Proteobacteria bacterium]|nr:alpha/beta hydrolase [Pseudomonadota bacterium]MBU1585107.1 alpha/beta hydrolase [Pseudomonadota bacterium]MBU2453510.1 alpha/beta hydrolase [Pseudomonadota bacterium]MBU2630650.1 alpha/beta hydrolase [Pseudomonadota bacterium]
MGKQVTIAHKNIQLEGVLQKKTSQKAVIICHPHPLYGGDMDNPVVMTIADSFFQAGFTTLRFNFRGTGNSTGTFDDGNGEQEDIRAVISWLAETGYPEIHLAGYSFGARMNALVVSKGCDIKDHIMVSPPVGFMSFDDIKTMSSTGFIVTGADDEIAPPDLIQHHINRWQIDVQYEVIENCDHFYSGCLPKLKTLLAAYLL